MSAELDALLAAGRIEPLDRAFATAGLAGLKRLGAELVGPCPACGGRDGFAIHPGKGKWNCRKAGIGGNDATGMVAHCLGLDLSRAEGLGQAAAAALGITVPGDPAREEALARRRALAEAEAARRDRAAEDHRAREIARALGKWQRGRSLAGTPGERYMALRAGLGQAIAGLRFLPAETLWHGQDDCGRPLALHCGPALVAAFIDCEHRVVGCHLTWIDLAAPPKYRPVLAAPEPVPTKKMRGSKKGGLIPLSGRLSARRWVGGEGVENVVAAAVAEGFPGGTFYFAAGDLGNLAGPGAAAGRTRHPHLTGATGRPVMLPTPQPREIGAAARTRAALWLPDHVTDLVLLADGDSEPYWTAAMMARAKARLAAPWRQVTVAWPPAGTDFAGMMLDAPVSIAAVGA